MKIEMEMFHEDYLVKSLAGLIVALDANLTVHLGDVSSVLHDILKH